MASDLDPIPRLVMLAFVFHASEKNGRRVWPGLERILWLTKLSRPCVKTTIRRLIQMGGLGEVVEEGARGRGAKRGFDVFPENLPERPPWRAGRVFHADQRGNDETPSATERGKHRTPFGTEKASKKGQRQIAKGATSDRERGNVRSAKGATSDTQEEDLVPEEDLLEVVQGRRSTGAIAPARSNPVDFKVYVAIASRALKESICEDGDDSIANVSERTKRLLAQQGIPYTGEIVRKAVDAAIAARDNLRDHWKQNSVHHGVDFHGTVPGPRRATRGA